MTEEEIKKIASEYAKNHCDTFVSAKLIECIIDGFCKQLSRDYCIVEKKAVAEWVNINESFLPDKRSVAMMKIGAKRLFGKEMFEEDKI